MKKIAVLTVVIALVVLGMGCPNESSGSASGNIPLPPSPFTPTIITEEVLVKSGSFDIGGGTARHDVTLTKSYYMGKTEVTQAQYVAVMRRNDTNFVNPSFNQPTTGWENLPITNVNWYDAVKFCNLLSAVEDLAPYYKIDEKTDKQADWTVEITDSNGRGYRLPTEAEWEYAARGGKDGDHTLEYAGTNVSTLGEYAWYYKNSGDSTNRSSHPVGTKLPNGLGLYDMSGNVFEWCWDWSDGGGPFGPDPMGFDTGSSRVFRGGSFGTFDYNCSVAYRNNSAPHLSRDGFHGFRVVRSHESSDSGNTPVTPFPTALVEKGSFDIGGGTARHDVTLTKSYYIGITEVTQAQYVAVMRRNDTNFVNPSFNQPTTGWENLPVTHVNWYDAVEFCNKLSEVENLTPYYEIDEKTDKQTDWTVEITDSNGKGYRLPIEAEWEYAARGGKDGDHTLEYAGTNVSTLGEYAWHSENSGNEKKTVGTKRPNGLGLYDMSGNVFEWCWNWGESTNPSVGTDPTGPYPAGSAAGWSRIFRGGSINRSADDCRVDRRPSYYPIGRVKDVGFRVVRSQ